MNTYIVKFDSPKPKLKHRALTGLSLAGIYFLLLFGWRFFHATSEQGNGGLLAFGVESGLASLVWGLMMVSTKRKVPTYKLLVDDESITGVTEYTGWMKWLATRRTISKGKVRAIWEVKGRLGVPGGMGFSERSEFGARMWGFVYLPDTLPNYDYLKTLAESWRLSEPDLR